MAINLRDVFEVIKLVNLGTLHNMETTNASIAKITSNPEVLNMLAVHHGLPFSDFIEDLAYYSELGPEHLLNLAAMRGDVRVVSDNIGKIDKGSQYENNKFLESVLVNAADYRKSEVVRFLLEAGVKDSKGDALKIAASDGPGPTIDTLIRYGNYTDFVPALAAAAKYGHVGLMGKFGDLGAEVDDRALQIDMVGILRMASVKCGNIEAVKWIVANMLPMSANLKNVHYNDALISANIFFHRACLRF